MSDFMKSLAHRFDTLIAAWDGFGLRFHQVYYVHISPETLSVRQVGGKGRFKDVPWLALSKERSVIAIGAVSEQAVAEEGKGAYVFKPFSHSRMLIADFEMASAMLDYAIHVTAGNFWRLTAIRPIVIVQPEPRFDDGFAEAEIRTLREAAIESVKARYVFIWSGRRELTDEEILSGRFPGNFWLGEAPWWRTEQFVG